MKSLKTSILVVGIVILTFTACKSKKSHPTDTNEIPNPASVYCEQNGNKLKIATTVDGSQSGLCVFPDGSTCDEWAYFRGECGPAAQNTPIPVIPDEATQKTNSDSVGENASGGYMEPGTSEAIEDWWGVIKSTESGAQFDDYFERQDLGGVIFFGIDSMDPAVQAKIKNLRDSGKIVHLNGTIFSNVPDYNGSQIQVDRIAVEE